MAYRTLNTKVNSQKTALSGSDRGNQWAQGQIVLPISLALLEYILVFESNRTKKVAELVWFVDLQKKMCKHKGFRMILSTLLYLYSSQQDKLILPLDTFSFLACFRISDTFPIRL